MLTQNEQDNLIMRFQALIGHLELKSVGVYENQLKDALDRILAAFIKSEDLTDLAARREIAKIIVDEMGKIYGDLGANILADMALMAQITDDVYKYIYSSSPVAKSLNFTKKTLLHGYELGDMLQSNETDAVKQFKRVIAQGLTEGSTYRQVTKELTDLGKKKFNHVSNVLVEAAMTEARWQSTDATYRQLEKEGILEGVEFNAFLEANTCDICRALDGSVYKNMDDLKKRIGQVSQHFNCRCVATVITSDAGDTKRAGVWYTEGERVPTQFKDMTYREWLKLQPKALQDALNSGMNLSRKQIMELVKL